MSQLLGDIDWRALVEGLEVGVSCTIGIEGKICYAQGSCSSREFMFIDQFSWAKIYLLLTNTTKAHT